MKTCSTCSRRWRLIFHYSTPSNKFPNMLSSLRNFEKKMKGAVVAKGVVSALVKHENTNVQWILPKKCQDLGTFVVPCTIGGCTFTGAMLDLGALINIMLTSIYRSLNLGDLESTGMVIQLANKSVVQPLGVLEDVLVQIKELIFPTNFYMLRR
ncbi:hypothetical protein CR513_18861, partial [Mucuna pruriens]